MRTWIKWDPREQSLGTVLGRKLAAYIVELPDLFADMRPPRFYDDLYVWLFAVWAEIATQQHVVFLLPTRYQDRYGTFAAEWSRRVGEPPPANLILGLVASTQAQLDEQIVVMMNAPAHRRALVLEPMGMITAQGGGQLDARLYLRGNSGERRIDWLVMRGREEPVHPAWVRSLLAQAEQAKIPAYFGGWGRWLPVGSCQFGTPEDHMLTMTSRGEKKHPVTIADMTAVGAPQGFIRLERLDTTCNVDMVPRWDMPEGL